MKTSASKSPVLIGLIAATAGFAGLAAVVKSGSQSAPGPLKSEAELSQTQAAPDRTLPQTRPGTKIVGEDSKPQVSDRSVVRFVTMEGETPTLTKELTLKLGEDGRLRSLAETIKSVGYADIRVLKVDIEQGKAMVDVSPSLRSQGFSSTSEAKLIEAMARTLGQFSDVNTFQLRVDGEIVDTLGHLELTEPTKVIRPGEKTDESETPSREPNP